MSEDMPEDMPGRVPEDMLEHMSEDMPGRMPEDMPDRMPEDMPENIPDSMTEGMPDRMSDRMPEGMPDKVPECLPEHMPEVLRGNCVPQFLLRSVSPELRAVQVERCRMTCQSLQGIVTPTARTRSFSPEARHHQLGCRIMKNVTGLILSMDWFGGNFTGNHGFPH